MPATYLDDVQLYHFNTCPFCIKVRLAMKVLGIKMKCKNIHSNLEFKTELIEGGGKKQVPCLRIEEKDGVHWLYESKDIVQYLRQRLK